MTPYVYDNAEAASNVTFKNFMRTHVRYFLPGHYKNLVEDSVAVQKWGDLEYLKEKLGD